MFEKFFLKYKQVAQLVYGLVLLVLIPLLIALNTVFVIEKYNKSIDLILQKEVYFLGRVLSSYLQDTVSAPFLLQNKLNKLKQENIDEIDDVFVLGPIDNDFEKFRVLASFDKKEVGKVYENQYYQLAWLQKNKNALVGDSSDLDFLKTDKNNRFWFLAIPLKDQFGKKQALLVIKKSSKIVDDLTLRNTKIALYFLVLLIFIVFLFLLLAVRFWNYALLYKKIKELDKMKDEFISVASHELRAPVTAIRGYASMIGDGSMGKINKHIKQGIDIINSSAKRLSALVEDLLNVSRIEQGRISLELSRVDIVPIIKNVIEELKQQAKEKNIKIKLNSSFDAPIFLKLDVDKFKQILINLLGNAIKYTKKGKVDVFLEKDGDYLNIKIKDTGIGMSAEEKKHLFEKFYRIKNKKTQGIPGTGLGLWISKKLTEMMNGEIFVDSIENTGTQFTLRFKKQ